MIAAMNFLYKVGSPMETKKQTRKTSSKTKELILEVAREIAAEKGVGQLTLEAVADRAGISKGGLLYHFPGKKELIIALMDSYVSHLSAELESATEPFKGHPQALVLGFIHWYKKFNGIAATNRTWGAAVFAVQSFDPQLMEPLHNWYRQLFEKRCEVVSRAGNCVADFYMENVLVVWLTGWAEWREYDEDNKKRLL